MDTPRHFHIDGRDIGVHDSGPGTVRVVAEQRGGDGGAQGAYVPAKIFELTLEPGSSISFETQGGESVCVFLVEGAASVHGAPVAQKTAILFGEGEALEVQAAEELPARLVVFAAAAGGGPLDWDGPGAQNTEEQVRAALRDLEASEFVLQGARGEVSTREWEQSGGESPEAPLDAEVE